MRKFRAIVQSSIEPQDHEVIWQWNGKLFYWNDGWEPLHTLDASEIAYEYEEAEGVENVAQALDKLLYVTPIGKCPKSLVHGKFCDIASCSSQGGTTVTFYPDYQIAEASLKNDWASTRAIWRSEATSHVNGGVFHLFPRYLVGYSYDFGGSRLIFRGNIIETTDIDEFLGTEEYRGAV